MSFLAPKVPDQATERPERQTYEFSGVLPVLFGVKPLAMKMVEHPWNETVTVPYGEHKPPAQYYSLAGWLGVGRMDGCRRLMLNNKPVLDIWREYGDEEDEWGNPMPYFDQQAEMGRSLEPLHFRFYWGADNQQPDPFLNGVDIDKRWYTTEGGRGYQRTVEHGHLFRAAPNRHPAYAGISYVVWSMFCTGYGQEEPGSGGQQLPTIEFECYRRPKAIRMYKPGTEDEAPLKDNEWHGCNAIAIGYDLLTDPMYSPSLPADLVPIETFQAATDKMDVEGYHGNWDGGVGAISPVFAQQETLAQSLSRLGNYYDGFWRVRGRVLEPGWFPNRGSLLPAKETLTIIDENDLVGVPVIEYPDAWQVTSEVTIKYSEPSEYFATVPVTERQSLPAFVRGDASAETLDAPDVINAGQARRMGQRFLLNGRLPHGSFKCLRRAARHSNGEPILPGDLFVFNYAPEGIDITARMVERREESAVQIQVKWLAERAGYDTDFTPVEDPRVLPELGAADPLEDVALLEVPFAAVGSAWPPEYWILGERPNGSILAADITRSRTGIFDGEEEPVGGLDAWACRGALAMAADEAAVQISFTLSGRDNRPVGGFVASEQAAGRCVVWIGNELVSLGTQISLVDDVYTYAVQRGFWRTSTAAHAESAGLWLFFPDTMQRWSLPLISAGQFVGADWKHYHHLLSQTYIESGETPAVLAEWIPANPDVMISAAETITGNVYEGIGTVYVGDVRRFGFTITPGSRPVVKVTAAVYFSPDDNPETEISENHVGGQVVYERVFPNGGYWLEESFVVQAPAMSVGWNGLYFFVQDARGEAYTRRLFGYYYAQLLPAPELATPLAGTAQLRLQADGTIITRALLTWTWITAEDAPYQRDLSLEVSYRWVDGLDAGPWEYDPLLPVGTISHYIENLKDNMNYQFRIRAKNAFGFISSFAATVSAFVSGKAEPPGEPTDLSGRGITALSVLLSWTPPGDLDLKHTNIYRNGVNVFDEAELVGSFVGSRAVIPVATPGEIYYYWAESEDTSRKKSDRWAFGQVKPLEPGALWSGASLPTTGKIVAYFSGVQGYGYRTHFEEDDDYIRWTASGGAAWGYLTNFVTIRTGIVYYFIRAASAPATPTDPAAGWSHSPPAGTDRLWITQTVLPHPTPTYSAPVECITESGGIPQTL